MNHFCKEVPIILVGCKTDLRKDRSLVKKLWRDKLEPVTYHRVGSPARGGVPGEGAPGHADQHSLSAAPGVQPSGCGAREGSETAGAWKWYLEYSGRFQLWKGEQWCAHQIALPTHIPGGGPEAQKRPPALQSAGPSLLHTREVSRYLERQRPSPGRRQESHGSHESACPAPGGQEPWGP